MIVISAASIFGAEDSQAQPWPIVDNSTSGNNTVKILGIDPTGYPKIKLNIFVDKFSAMAGNLDKIDFLIEEDSNQVDINDFYFVGNASGQMLDLAVVFDNTNSMQQEIDGMKSKVKDLTDSLDAAGIDASYSLVSFGNDVSVRAEWTDDPAAFKREVDALTVISGIDEPENPLDAIEAVLSMGFRLDAQKVILAITDDRAHHKDDGSGISNYTKEEVTADLKESGVILVVVSPEFEGTTEYLDLREVANDIDSVWINIESENFSDILEQFKGMLTGSYVVEYTTSDEIPSMNKTVSVFVNVSEGIEASTSSSYITPSIVAVPNKPPIISALTSDKTSPQEAGTEIIWTAEASDPEGDQILFRFFLDNKSMTDWTADKMWTWTTEQPGLYWVEVQVRDGMSAGIDGMENRKSVSFEIVWPSDSPTASNLTSSSSSENFLALGLALMNQSKYDEAILAYDEAIRLDPEDAASWGAKGFALSKLGRHDEAMQVYDEALRLDTNFSLAWIGKGFALKDLGKYDEAIQAFDEAIKLDPESDMAWYGKGIVLHNQGKYDEAIQAYDEAVRLDPEDIEVWKNKGSTLLKQRKYDEAIYAIDEALRLDPEDSGAWSIKASILLLQRKYNEANQAFNEVIRLNPGDAMAWNLKGYALESLGRKTEADAAYARARSLG